MISVLFIIRNWKTGHAFWTHRVFRSLVEADRFCARIALAKNSPYTCAKLDWHNLT